MIHAYDNFDLVSAGELVPNTIHPKVRYIYGLFFCIGAPLIRSSGMPTAHFCPGMD